LRPTGINQLWVADFTYVRLFGAFIFVAIVLDAFSRRCIGWALATHYRTELTLEALRIALRRRRPSKGCVHHSDRGVQYSDKLYVDELTDHGIQISMSCVGKPANNAVCERFMRTFKEDEVLLREYFDLADARLSIAQYLDVTYNLKRLHSALGYRPPAEFEKLHLEPAPLPIPA
jgi:putative transposase